MFFCDCGMFLLLYNCGALFLCVCSFGDAMAEFLSIPKRIRGNCYDLEIQQFNSSIIKEE